MGKLTSKFYLVILSVSFFSFSCQKKSNEESVVQISNSMKENRFYSVLKEVSATSIDLANDDFNKSDQKYRWLGRNPATKIEVKELEARLNLKLPDDYKEFLVLSNGFKATSSVEPHFMNTSKVGFLRILDPELIRLWCEFGNKEIEDDLSNSILIGGLNDEQYFLLIQPNDKYSQWRYWKFAHWIPGEHEYPDFKSYWLNVLEFNKREKK